MTTVSLRRLLLGVLPLVLLVSAPATAHADMFCPDTVYGSDYDPSLPIVEENVLLVKGIPLVDEARVICHVEFLYGRPTRVNERYRIETGELNGRKYKIYHTDGSGTLQGLPGNDLMNDKYGTNWDFSCHIDRIDDTHWCRVSKGTLRVGIWKNGTQFLSVGLDRYPNSNIAVRVDKNEPFIAPPARFYIKEFTEPIIEQMINGQSIITRYQEWPYQANKDEQLPLFGFNESWDLLNRLYMAVRSNNL